MRNELQMEDFRLALLSVWRAKLLIVCLAVFGMFTGLFYTLVFSGAQNYRADSSVYCAIYNNTSRTSGLTTDVTAAVTNYTDVISSDKVAQYAASLITDKELTADDIRNMVTIQTNSNSYLISISGYSDSPQLAIEVANAVAQSFVSEMANITDSASVHILDTAGSAALVQTTSKTKMILAGMLLPVLAACAVILLRSLISDRVYSVMQCVDSKDEILGIVPEID